MGTCNWCRNPSEIFNPAWKMCDLEFEIEGICVLILLKLRVPSEKRHVQMGNDAGKRFDVETIKSLDVSEWPSDTLKMDEFGLPISFGKQASSSKPVKLSDSAEPVPRGSASTRGPRGVVGAGKRGRGRGKGQGEGTATDPIELQSDGHEGLNEGVKVSLIGRGGIGARLIHKPATTAAIQLERIDTSILAFDYQRGPS